MTNRNSNDTVTKYRRYMPRFVYQITYIGDIAPARPRLFLGALVALALELGLCCHHYEDLNGCEAEIQHIRFKPLHVYESQKPTRT